MSKVHQIAELTIGAIENNSLSKDDIADLFRLVIDDAKPGDWKILSAVAMAFERYDSTLYGDIVGFRLGQSSRQEIREIVEQLDDQELPDSVVFESLKKLLVLIVDDVALRNELFLLLPLMQIFREGLVVQFAQETMTWDL